MLAGCGNQALLKRNAAATISCSSYTKGRYKGLPNEHCGYCVPCLNRSVALWRPVFSERIARAAAAAFVLGQRPPLDELVDVAQRRVGGALLDLRVFR